MSETPTVGEAVPDAQRGSWTSFLKSIASFSGDLSSLTAPPFILSPVSLTEFPAYWCERPELFAAIADATSDEDRAKRVLRWFISTLKGQYTSRNESMGSEKKPLNPVLGEVFYAYYICNPEKGVSLQGHSAQKTSFSGGSIIVKQIGHATLTVTLPNGEKDEYLITLPRLRIDGLWYGSPYIELCETSWIVSASGWVSTIEYKGKGYFSGKSHSYKATLTPPPSSRGLPTHIFEGTWHEKSKNVKTGELFHDVTGPKEEVSVKPVEEMDEWESRKLWGLVSKGIREGDFELASREKTRIENEQRQRRRDEVAAGTKWELKHFVHVDSDPTYERYGKFFNANPPTEDAYVFQHNPPLAEFDAPATGA
ncbi:hypothetical protein JAAARDRAFT_398176 [Jaapia argillacea MUCL 33604]|uniref:Oxysterol-binding protein n=1 Tax=Jaapia argillacea MUCL 33604 TaxID=933084 RepID=A0A067PIE5_9AGAM|nr:hypothetical protein JAAARDRAFT_398176 [Jaapia argillacea MUCL 33604]